MERVADLRPPSTRTTTWPHKHHGRKVNDVVHSSIGLYHPLDVIIDTPEFQRLRRVKQLGVASLVYPSADHSRFSHSLGACHIAQEVMEALRADDSLGLDSEDALAVAIAALVHDIGHGPYSHLFDGPFLEAVGKKGTWSHEDASKALLHRIFSRPHVREALKEYLGGEDEERFERNLLFIQECIKPPRLLGEDGEWMAKGRGREKSFLYDIVSNEWDGFDVDKFDYLLRDALLAGVGIRFNKGSLLRIIHNLRVLPDPTHGILRICFAKKTAEELLSVADSRATLHSRVYQHGTAKVIEAMVVEALAAADGHLVFEDDAGTKFTLSTLMDSLDVFVATDDSILQRIEYSRDPSLGRARRILQQIQSRKMPTQIHIEETSPRTVRRNNNNESLNVIAERSSICKEIKTRLLESVTGAETEEVFILSRCLFGGLDGTRNPMTEALVYDNKQEKPEAERLNGEWLSLRATRESALLSFALYTSRDTDADVVKKFKTSFKRILEDYGIRKATGHV